jgi:hypothetical protein
MQRRGRSFWVYCSVSYSTAFTSRYNIILLQHGRYLPSTSLHILGYVVQFQLQLLIVHLNLHSNNLVAYPPGPDSLYLYHIKAPASSALD